MTPKHKRARAIFERDNFVCLYCGKQFSPDYAPLHIHRRVFGSQGGTYISVNMATCCFVCHSDHGNLKNRKLITEGDMIVMDGLVELFKL